MCRLRSLLTGAALIVATLDFTASPAMTGLATGATVAPAPLATIATQSVDRRHKSDRLFPAHDSSRMIERMPAATGPAPILEGCSPAFSPLSSSAALNYPARCVADAGGRSFA